MNSIEKFIEPYAEQIRTHQVELVQLDNPMRFSIKPIDNDKPLITIPREFNDCLLALISRSDPLRKSDLITELIPDKISEDVKANSLDIRLDEIDRLVKEFLLVCILVISPVVLIMMYHVRKLMKMDK